jgi:hypothetical protein
MSGVYIKDMELPRNPMILHVYIKNGKPCITSITDCHKGHMTANYEMVQIPQDVKMQDIAL